LGKSKLAEYINKCELEKASNEFGFIKAGGKENGGLCLRRLRNISDFYGTQINKKEITAMKNLQLKMLCAYENRIRTAKGKAAKLKVKSEEAFFRRESNGLIASAAGPQKEQKSPNSVKSQTNIFGLLASNR
jgi:hypothetical protein